MKKKIRDLAAFWKYEKHQTLLRGVENGKTGGLVKF
jgi:hypothetical protein